jgi:cholesterol oxidase
MPTTPVYRTITLPQLAATFVPFGLLLVVALFAAEQTQNVSDHRMIYAIWLCIALLIPAMCLYALPQWRPGQRNYALLFWTFSYLAYLVHFYYAVWVHFGGIAGTFRGMAPFIAGTNFFLTAWWTVDVALAWLVSPERGWLRAERNAVHLFLFVIFAITALVLRPNPVTLELGIILAAAVPVCFLLRLWFMYEPSAQPGAEVASPTPSSGPPDMSTATTSKPGLRFTETMKGHASTAQNFLTAAPPGLDVFLAAEKQGRQENSTLEFTVTISTDDLDALLTDDTHPATIAGTATAPALAKGPMQVTRGDFNLLYTDKDKVAAKGMRYRMALRADDGQVFFLDGVKHIETGSALNLWPQTTTLYTTVYRGGAATGPAVLRGVVHIAPTDFARQLGTIQVTNASSALERLEATARFGKWFAGSLFETYGGFFARPAELDPSLPPRERRPLRNPKTQELLVPEVYYFQTSDGLELRLMRYHCGDKGPLLMVHGLGVSSLIFTVDTIDTNLVEFLAPHGYDMWLLDYRASVDLPYADKPYTADHVAAIDYPEAVEQVRRLTGKDTVQCLVHCYGATTFFMAMLHEKARANAMRFVRSAAVSQIATHVRVGPIVETMSVLHVPNILEKVFGVESMTARTSPHLLDRALDDVLKFWPADADTEAHRLLLISQDKNPVSRRITFLYGALYELPQLNHDTYWDGLGRMFGVAGIKSLQHLATMIRAGHSVTADGQEAYLPHVKQLAIPIRIVHGAKNRCWLPVSTALTMDWLREHNDPGLYDRVVVPGYGHIDCIFGKNAARDVYPYWLEHLEKTAAG